ncbi:HAS-barrel domain-containing protein [Thermosynechococcus sp.]|uniref:HAS-barrel domain-containing protein n=1 Tax=Thermosynechococcus sp. TaxID=2814275 RepID=UPI003918EF14
MARQSPSPQPFAEIVQTATDHCLAQCHEPATLDFPVAPALGSWVQIPEGDRVIYGVVAYVVTAPIDTIHRATALGLSLEQLRQEQPHIFAMLKTEVTIAIAGFQEQERFYHHLPPHPPQMHQQVYSCPPEEVIAFSGTLSFLRTLLTLRYGPGDALVAATLRSLYQLRRRDRQWLVQASQYLNRLLKDDYDRLRGILEQL